MLSPRFALSFLVLILPQTAQAGAYLAQGVVIKSIGVNYSNTDAIQLSYSYAPGSSVQQDACNGTVQFYLSRMNQSRFDKLYQASVTAYLSRVPLDIWSDISGSDCSTMTEMVLK